MIEVNTIKLVGHNIIIHNVYLKIIKVKNCNDRMNNCYLNFSLFVYLLSFYVNCSFADVYHEKLI